MGLLGHRVVGLGSSYSHMDSLRGWYGKLLRSLELGVGCGRDALRTTGARRRSHVTNRGLLSRLDHTNGCYGMGLGDCGLGWYEVFQTCQNIG